MVVTTLAATMNIMALKYVAKKTGFRKGWKEEKCVIETKVNIYNINIYNVKKDTKKENNPRGKVGNIRNYQILRLTLTLTTHNNQKQLYFLSGRKEWVQSELWRFVSLTLLQTRP